jgi:putative transposase
LVRSFLGADSNHFWTSFRGSRHELRAGLNKWITYYNAERPHSKHGGATPDEAYSKIETQPDPGLTPDQAEPELKLAA